MKFKRPTKKQIRHISRIFFWFFIGAFLSAFLISSFAFIIFQKTYENLAYPGVKVDGVPVARMNRSQIENYFSQKNKFAGSTVFKFTYENQTATASAEDLDLGFDEELIVEQALSIGRSNDPISNMSIILQSYLAGIELPPSYRFSVQGLEEELFPLAQSINRIPVDALFQFENGKVTAFRPSSNGRRVNQEKIGDILLAKAPKIFSRDLGKTITIPVSVDEILPNVSTDKANNLGIKELVGVGTSLFQHSIPERIYNITLAASRINGVLVAPGDTFSFDKVLGDISAFTGYKQAYVIENGRTVLGDGGGVCQVSTTFFRAILDAGLPVTDRTAHAYRVGYYEQDSPPGIDATIFVPSVDLKFKNDTSNHILVQTSVDPEQLRLTVYLYGTKDGRLVTMSKPVVTNQVAPPAPLYQDDPTLPQGTIKQVDFEAWGASAQFSREVKKDGKVIISEKFTSNYRPWRAVFLKGTKT